MAGSGEQVSRERLLQLLDQGESENLDFKSECDLSNRYDQVAITKDIGALAARGGHLVIGAEEDGTPSGKLTQVQAGLFDESRLRSKIAPKYLPESISITTAAHQVEGHTVAVVYVEPHPDGFVVMQRDGDYETHDGKPAQEFRGGDVFVRRGTSSVKWNQSEAHDALDRAVAARKEEWRAELREDLAGIGLGNQAQQIARGPAAAFTWQLDADAFAATLIELLRTDDDIAITLALDAMLRDARTAWAESDLEQLRVILDRVVSTAGVAITVRRPELLRRAVRMLVDIYDLGFDESGYVRGGPAGIPSAILWLEIITRVYAVGALAVRKDDWNAVSLLTLQKGRGHDFDYYPNWLRHALTQAARAGRLEEQQEGRRVELSLLVIASEHVDRLPGLRPDVAPGDDAIISSLTQFDLLSILAAIADERSADGRVFYTNFARFNWSRSEPALIRLLTDPDARQTLFPLGDDDLAAAIREVGQRASAETHRFAVWPGWNDERIDKFVAEHHPDTNP